MKKVILGLFLLVVSILPCFFSYAYVYAEQDEQISTIYPNNVLDYVNLDNISAFDINEKYISYTTNKVDLNIYNIDTKENRLVKGFNSITRIKFAGNSLTIVDSNQIKVIKDIQSGNVSTLSEINLNNLQTIDIYSNNSNIYIGIIKDNTFYKYKYDINFVAETNNPIETTTNEKFQNAFLMAINENSAYIIYKIDDDGTQYTTGLCIKRHDKSEINQPTLEFSKNARLLDTFIFENQEFLITITSENFYLLSSDNTLYSKDIDINKQGDLENNYFPINKVTDTAYFNDTIYISDSYYKTIQSYIIDTSDDKYTLKSNKLILASSSFDYGRFNGVQDIFVQGNNLVVSDTLNNRIHILEDNESKFISLESNTLPHSVILDKDCNMYFVTNELENSSLQNKLVKYKYISNENNYVLESKYFKNNSLSIGNIADICLSNSNNVYLLDYTNSKILYLSGSDLVELDNSNISKISFDSKSQLQYLKSQNRLVIKAGNKIYLISCDGSVLSNNLFISTIELSNLQSIAVDFDNVLAITSDHIYSYNIENDNFVLNDNNMEFDSTNYSSFSYDIVQRQMFAFDKYRSCIVKFDCQLTDSKFNLLDISNTEQLDYEKPPIPLKIKTKCLIYEYPNELGNCYNQDNNVQNLIGIEEFNNYYRVLFSCDKLNLLSGYISKSNVEILPYNYNVIKVLTTNQKVPVYKYPTLLSYKGKSIISDYLSIETSINLSYLYPVSLDGRTFYAYQKGSKIGFIFDADVVSEDKTIKTLNTENATIRLIGKQSTQLLAEDKQTVIRSLKNNDRIYVKEYDKNSKYTKVIVKDNNYNTYEGFVLTEDITMDKLDNSRIVLIIIIVVSVVLLATIITFYVIIKKKNK